MAPLGELSRWLRWLNVAMWLLAAGAIVLQAGARAGPFPLECLAWSGLAFALCLLSFACTQRLGRRPGGRGALVTGAMALQLLLVLFLVRWWQGVFGGFLLVLTAWQGALLWPARRALAWAGLQTLGLAAVVARGPDASVSVLLAAIIGGLQAFAVLLTHAIRRESEARLALARTNAELRDAHAMLQEAARDSERLRLARELHDGMGHGLAALALDLEAALHQPEPSGRETLVRSRGLVTGLLGELRQVVSRLRTERPEDLRVALEAITASIRRPQVHVELDGATEGLDPVHTHALVRCVQELVTNAVKHSGAENLWIRVAITAAAVELGVADDGRGAATLREGYGLAGIRERASQLGGRVRLGGAGRGFAATVWLPRAGAAA